MKILWVNSSFLDYRIPVYKRLNELSGDNFYIVYAHSMVPARIPPKIEAAIGNHAIGIEDNQSCIGKTDTLANKSLRIPHPKGLGKVIRDVNPDILIGEGFFQWTPYALWYSFVHRKKILIDYERTKWTERDCPWWRLLYRKIVDRFTDGYLCNGKLVKEYLESIGVKATKLFQGGMSADGESLSEKISAMSQQEKDLMRRSLRIKDDGLVYVYVGGLIPRKGVDLLLNAWVEHSVKYPNDSIILVGSGEMEADLKKKYGEMESVLFVGGIDYDNIYKYYAISDVFVIATIEDNWSLVVPEAMACGLPIACSIYNGCYPELCQENRNGVLFDPFQQDSIIKALEKFHNVDMDSYGKQSIEIEKGFTHHVVAQNIFAACQIICNK